MEKRKINFENVEVLALAGVTQLIEHQPENQRVTSSISSRGIHWGAGQVPRCGVCKRQLTLMFLSLSFSLPSILSKNKQIKYLKRKCGGSCYIFLSFVHPSKYKDKCKGLI